ncbi:hypothetical protein SBRCBS47491_003402 [Sporothrix bragantina]|uniref:Uncharacterized protein n=1 Tax=Sporothrix bragantina TaxID=671064 RepID=A0ABP0BFW9_9PEZI
MCHLVTIVWSCGHTVVSYTPCKDAVVLEGGKKHKDATDKYMACSKYYEPCKEVKLIKTPNPKSIPFCQFSSCVPNYWSCCQCQPIKAFGSLGGDESGKKQATCRERMERLAPTSTAENAERDLQLGDGVCGDDMDEENRAGYGQPPSVAEVPCSNDETCYGCFTQKFANEQEMSLEEARECMAEVQDMVPLLLEESVYAGETDCGHVRCDKCIRWRRCPCNCLCANVIPSTRRSCNLCVLSRCEAVEISGLRNRLKKMAPVEEQE